jgi:hypothetical protein
MEYEFKTKSTYGDIKGANLLDWPISLKDMEPYYTKAEDAIGSTHRGGRTALPANNNYKVFANGAKNVGYKFYLLVPMELMLSLTMVDLVQYKTVLIFRVIKMALNGAQLKEKYPELWILGC